MGPESLAKFVLALSVAAVAGCSATSSTDDAASTESRIREDEESGSSLEAKTESIRIDEARGFCRKTLNVIHVSLENSDAASRINRVLEKANPDLWDAYVPECKGTMYIGGMNVGFNERGWLSITNWTERHPLGPGTRNEVFFSFETWNFDLTTGKLLGLKDVVDAEGIKILGEGCLDAVESFQEEHDDFFEASAFCDPAQNKDLAYSVDKKGEGLRIHPVGLRVVTSEGASTIQGSATVIEGALVPWSDLDGHITNDRLKSIAQ